MKKRIAIIVVLMMVFCLALTGCAQKTDKPEDGRGDSPTVTEKPAEDFSQTPESLDGTAWILKGETERGRCFAMFFKNGTLSIVSQEYYFDATYRYENHIMTTDPEEVGFDGVVDGNKMTVTQFSAPYCELTRVSIEEAIRYAKAINEDIETPFDSDYPGFDFDTGDSGIMDGSNNGTQNGSQNADGTYTWQVGKYTLTTRINIMDYIDGDVWRANEMAIAMGWNPIGIDGNVNRNVEKPSMFATDSLVLRYSINTSTSYCTGLIGHNRGENRVDVFNLLSPVDYGDHRYSMNGGKIKWTFETIVCFAYAAEQLPNNPTTNPFDSVFTSGAYYER